MVKPKTQKEIKIMKEGGRILGEILRKLTDKVEPGMPTNDLEKLARELVLSYKAKSSFLNYNNYPSMLCVSLNDEIVHGQPSKRVIKKGDLIKLDMGIFHKGFHTDSAVTVLVSDGKSNLEKEKLLNTTKEALKLGITAAKLGNTIGDIGQAVQEFVESQGFNVVRDLVGHGIGRNLHESPQVPNYGRSGEGEKLVSGLVIAIEPMVVVGNWEIKRGKDGFAYKTKDGKLAAHFEHTIAISLSGPVILTE